MYMGSARHGHPFHQRRVSVRIVAPQAGADRHRNVDVRAAPVLPSRRERCAATETPHRAAWACRPNQLVEHLMHALEQGLRQGRVESRTQLLHRLRPCQQSTGEADVPTPPWRRRCSSNVYGVLDELIRPAMPGGGAVQCCNQHRPCVRLFQPAPHDVAGSRLPSPGADDGALTNAWTQGPHRSVELGRVRRRRPAIAARRQPRPHGAAVPPGFAQGHAVHHLPLDGIWRRFGKRLWRQQFAWGTRFSP